MGVVTCKIWALQGNVLIPGLGGQAQIGKFPLWDGRLISQNCNGKLKTTDSNHGIGLSWHRIHTSADFNCEDHCEFKTKTALFGASRVELTIFTIVFITVTKVTMHLCDTKSVWHVGLGLGLGWNGAVWEVDVVN